MAGNLSKTIGANQSTAIKPMTTEGNDAIISMTGLIVLLMVGLANCDVNNAANKDTGTAKSIV